MYSKSVDILRYINAHDWIPLEDLLEYFGDTHEIRSCIYSLKSDGQLLYKLPKENKGERYALSPAARGYLEEINRNATLEKENFRLQRQISDSLEELKGIREIAESSRKQAEIATEKANKADWKGWIALFLSAATFFVYLFEVFG